MKYKVILFDVNKESHDIIKMDGILNGMINIKKS